MPPRRDPVWTLEEVPGRPDARVVLTYDHESGFIYGIVHQSEPCSVGSHHKIPHEDVNVAFLYNGEKFKVGTFGQLDEGPVNDALWTDANKVTLFGEPVTDAEAIAYRVLCASGDFCNFQARTDFTDPDIRNAAAWKELVREARDLYSICRVMMR